MFQKGDLVLVTPDESDGRRPFEAVVEGTKHRLTAGNWVIWNTEGPNPWCRVELVARPIEAEAY
jgi:hypothetical protein